MIEKIKNKTGTYCGQTLPVHQDTIINKINALIDTVNTIQNEREAEKFEIQEWIGIFEAVRKSVNKLETMAKNTNTVLESLVQENNIHEKQIDELQMKVEPEKCETPVDPYAEQRRWIGKLCRFWDDDAFVTSNDWAFGILTGIDKGMQFQYCCNENCNFKHCEPVSPTDNAIYKRE